MYKKIAALVVSLSILTPALSADLFEDGKLRPIKLDDPIVQTDTIGGYAIYPGEGLWKFVRGSESTSTGSGDNVKIGYIHISQSEGNALFARQLITANLQQSDIRSWGGSPCATGHLVMRNKGRGRADGCMTIDPIMVNVGNTPVLMLSIVLTNSGSGGRFNRTTLDINPALLGVRNTGLGDWTPEYVASKPHRKAFMDKLTAWAEKFQDSSIEAFGYSKPQDAYNEIVSLRTLLPVPADLVSAKRSLEFLSVVEYLQYVKGYAALAFSPKGDYKTQWEYVSDKPSQEEADKLALANCESKRATSLPACALYKIPVAPIP